MAYLFGRECSKEVQNLIRDFLDGKASLVRDDKPMITGSTTQLDAFNWITTSSLGNLAPQGTQPPLQWKSEYQEAPKPCVKKKALKHMEQSKETDMRYDYTSTNNEQAQRSYALSRLEEIRSNKNQGLRKQFHLDDDEAPQSLNDMLARFTSGQFVFPEDKKDKQYGWYSVFDMIRWRDPAVKEDDAGYKTANDKLSTVYQTSRDAIALGTPTDAKATLDTFSTLTIQ